MHVSYEYLLENEYMSYVYISEYELMSKIDYEQSKKSIYVWFSECIVWWILMEVYTWWWGYSWIACLSILKYIDFNFQYMDGRITHSSSDFSLRIRVGRC